MTKRGIKICKGCRRSFEPQLTDDEIFDLWFTEEEIEADEQHFEQTGHSHLNAPIQELCAKCSVDPDLYPVHGPFGGPTQYRRKTKMKKIKVQEDAPLRGLVPDMIMHDEFVPEHAQVHDVVASDGTKMQIHGPKPPQEIIDAMAAAVRAGQVEGTIKQTPKKAVITITREKKKPSIWELLFGKKKKK